MSTTIAIVIDNVDPSKMHRIKVKFTTDTVGGRNSHSSWCRMLTPMAGSNRGMVMLPEVGTEVVVGFAYRSMTPYILGAVYNGVDLPEPYRNDDCLNNVRVFWSRNDHMVVFDDTEGAEQVGFGAQAPDRLDVTSAGMHGVLDSSQGILSHHSDGDSIVEAGQTISIRCANFSLEASATIDIESGTTTTIAAGSNALIDGGNEATFDATAIQLNPSSPAATPQSSLPMPPHSHPPVLGGGIGLNALSDLPGGTQGSEGDEVEQSGEEAKDPGAAAVGGEGDAWDDLRDKTKSSVDSAVDDAVSDLIGGRIGDALGDAAGSLAARGVDAAFDAAEAAIGSAFGSGSTGTGRDDGTSPSDSSRPAETGPTGVRGPDGRAATPTLDTDRDEAIRPEAPGASAGESDTGPSIEGSTPKPDGLDPSASGTVEPPTGDAPADSSTSSAAPPTIDGTAPVSEDSIDPADERPSTPAAELDDAPGSGPASEGSPPPESGDGTADSSEPSGTSTSSDGTSGESTEPDSIDASSPETPGTAPSEITGSAPDDSSGSADTSESEGIDATPQRDDGLADRVRTPGPSIDGASESEQRDRKRSGGNTPSGVEVPFDIDEIIDELNPDDGEG